MKRRSEIRLELLTGAAELFASLTKIAGMDPIAIAIDVIGRQEAKKALAQAARDFVAAETEENAEEARQAAKAERAKTPRKPRQKKAVVEGDGLAPVETLSLGVDANGVPLTEDDYKLDAE